MRDHATALFGQLARRTARRSARCRTPRGLSRVRARPIAARARGSASSVADRVLRARRVAGRHEQSAHAVLDELGDAGDGRADDRAAAGHRFHQRDRDAFHLPVVGDDARQHEERASAIIRVTSSCGAAEEMNDVFDTALADQGASSSRIGPWPMTSHSKASPSSRSMRQASMRYGSPLYGRCAATQRMRSPIAARRGGVRVLCRLDADVDDDDLPARLSRVQLLEKASVEVGDRADETRLAQLPAQQLPIDLDVVRVDGETEGDRSTASR